MKHRTHRLAAAGIVALGVNTALAFNGAAGELADLGPSLFADGERPRPSRRTAIPDRLKEGNPALYEALSNGGVIDFVDHGKTTIGTLELMSASGITALRRSNFIEAVLADKISVCQIAALNEQDIRRIGWSVQGDALADTVEAIAGYRHDPKSPAMDCGLAF